MEAPEKILRLELPQPPSPFGEEDVLIEMKDLTFAYGDHVILKQMSLCLRGRDRLCITGRNGSGKSTLLKILAQSISVEDESIHHHPNLTIGYVGQHLVSDLGDDEATPLEICRVRFGSTGGDLEIRKRLGSFGLSEKLPLRPLFTLSGGQRTRLALALATWRDPQLLILDEITNNMDIESIDMLKTAIEEFQGAIVLVSHDRGLVGCMKQELVLSKPAES